MNSTFDLPFAMNRRVFLGKYAGAIGSLALLDLLRASGADATRVSSQAHDVVSRVPGVPGGARAIISLFQHGGPSQMDLFDPKPELTKRHGTAYAGDLEAHFDKQKGNLLCSPFRFKKCGGSGIELCELLSHTGQIADEITLVRSMTTDSVDHEAALRLIHSGNIRAGRPVFGSWVVYALGSENRNLPAFVVLGDPAGLPVDGVKNWSSGWLPAIYQGTVFRSGASPVLNLRTPAGIPPGARERQLEFLSELNRIQERRYPANAELAARIANFETAARMQTAVPEVLDLSDETQATRAMYGLDDEKTREYGTRCLLARRLVERGVRFVQIFLNGQPWDTHSKNAETLKGLCGRTDQPSAALVKDLKQRGLLDTTIVLWTGEFGRLPISQGADGRDHNRHGFSLWLAGGGFKRGYVHGETDEFGYRAIKDIVRVYDLQATLLAALGIPHRELTYPNAGRRDSLTDADVTGATVVPALLE
jgi:hypothetical protein